jgi:hypothetical protein
MALFWRQGLLTLAVFVPLVVLTLLADLAGAPEWVRSAIIVIGAVLFIGGQIALKASWIARRGRDA